MTEVGGNTDQFSATSTGTATRFREVRTILQGKKKKKTGWRQVLVPPRTEDQQPESWPVFHRCSWTLQKSREESRNQ